MTELTVFQYSHLLFNAFSDTIPSSEEGKEIMNICFYLSFFLTEPNGSICEHETTKYTQSIQQFIDPNIAKLITSFIVQKSDYLKWIELTNMKNAEFHSYESQINYSYNNHIVDFGNARRDYLNIPTSLLSAQCFSKYFINIYCLGKDDESWLGLIEKDAYSPTFNARCHKKGLFYYGGREYSTKRYGGSINTQCHGWSPGNPTDCNHGSIQGKNKLIKHPIQSYSSGDWINFEIDFIHKTMRFYKNGKEQYVAKKKYFPNAPCYFIVELDTQSDKFYIEQAHDAQCVAKDY